MEQSTAARKPPTVKERRARTVLIRLSESEMERARDRARAAGRPLACFIREAALGSAPRHRHVAVNELLVHRLARLGVLLRDVSTAANRAGLADTQAVDAALEALLDTIRAVD